MTSLTMGDTIDVERVLSVLALIRFMNSASKCYEDVGMVSVIGKSKQNFGLHSFPILCFLKFL